MKLLPKKILEIMLVIENQKMSVLVCLIIRNYYVTADWKGFPQQGKFAGDPVI